MIGLVATTAILTLTKREREAAWNTCRDCQACLRLQSGQTGVQKGPASGWRERASTSSPEPAQGLSQRHRRCTVRRRGWPSSAAGLGAALPAGAVASGLSGLLGEAVRPSSPLGPPTPPSTLRLPALGFSSLSSALASHSFFGFILESSLLAFSMHSYLLLFKLYNISKQ